MRVSVPPNVAGISRYGGRALILHDRKSDKCEIENNEFPKRTKRGELGDEGDVGLILKASLASDRSVRISSPKPNNTSMNATLI